MLHVLIIPAVLELPSRRGATSPKRDLRGGQGQAPPQLQIRLQPAVIIIPLFIRRHIFPPALQFAQLFPQPRGGGAAGRRRAPGPRVLAAASPISAREPRARLCPASPLLAQASFPVLRTHRTIGAVGMCGESWDTDTIMGRRWGELWGLGAECKEPREGSEGPASWESVGRLDLICQMGWTPAALKCNDVTEQEPGRKPLVSRPARLGQAECLCVGLTGQLNFLKSD